MILAAAAVAARAQLQRQLGRPGTLLVATFGNFRNVLARERVLAICAVGLLLARAGHAWRGSGGRDVAAATAICFDIVKLVACSALGAKLLWVACRRLQASLQILLHRFA